MKQIGKLFIEETKVQKLGASHQAKGYRQPPLETEFDQNANIIDLPQPDLKKCGADADFNSIISKRCSRRNYSGEPLTLEELSYLLWCTQGVKYIIPETVTYRNVPSAGSRHAFDTYILANRVVGLNPGLYRFAAIAHKLLEFDLAKGVAEKVTAGCLGQKFILDSAVTFLWVADVYRMTWRYGQRGYRYLHLDAGHVCQNLYLAAEAIGVGACAIGAFDDDALNGLLGLDGINHFVIYAATVGKKTR
jgi:SagB-type dehydrogenase family enzyme